MYLVYYRNKGRSTQVPYIFLTDYMESTHTSFTLAGKVALSREQCVFLVQTCRSLVTTMDPSVLKVKERNITINNQLTESFYRLRGDINVNPQLWIDGQESFLIRCTRKSFEIDGFLAVRVQNQQERQANGQQFRTICRPDAFAMTMDVSEHMAFRLHHTIPQTDESRQANTESES